MAFEVPPLPYDYGALEPTIDEQTMRLHHDKHHQAYVDNANAALQGTEHRPPPRMRLLGVSRCGHTSNKRRCQQQRAFLLCLFLILHQLRTRVRSFNCLNGGEFANPAVQSYGCDGR